MQVYRSHPLLSLVVVVSTFGCSAEDTSASDDALRAAAGASGTVSAEWGTDLPKDSPCPGSSASPSRAAAERLAHAFGTWRFARRNVHGMTKEVSRCDSMMVYRIGLADDPRSAMERASCALVRSEIIPFRAARIEAPGCPMVECGGSFGLVWYETNGSVFGLDADGNPTGMPLLTFEMQSTERGEYVLVQTNSGTGPTDTQTVLARTEAQITCAP